MIINMIYIIYFIKMNIQMLFQYSEFISKIFSEAASIFSSFDVVLKGDFSFPRQQGLLFAVSIPIPVAGLLIIDFSMILTNLNIYILT